MMEDGVFLPRDLPMWADARPYLDVRTNDEHTVIAYGIARMLLDQIPEADESVVLPAILLHDVGWKMIPQELLLDAIGRNPTRLDLVREHELHSVKIAREILEKHKPEGVDIDAVLEIIDGHDTTREAKSINDAVVKDADKGWRSTPHGMRTIEGWYDCGLPWVISMLEERSNDRMLTAPGKALAEGQTAAVKAELMLGRYLGGADA
ncbi:HD domain-containing protein [Rhodovulum sp. DZ06]|uniref:HD domain-containing protein n=1 Tax=Rhodovulum sp. DZ06 TaxID=3425126 RepID=UPI003D352315